MNTLAFRAFGQPAPRRTPAIEPSSTTRPSGGAAGILASIAALAGMAILVVVVRVGVYAWGHSDQPIFQMLVDRLTP